MYYLVFSRFSILLLQCLLEFHFDEAVFWNTDVQKDKAAPISSDSVDSKEVTVQGLDSAEGKAIFANVQEQETTAAYFELTTQ